MIGRAGMKRRALCVLFFGTLLSQILFVGLYPNAVNPDLLGIAHHTGSTRGLLTQVLNLIGNLIHELPLVNGVLMQRMISRRFPTTRVLSNITPDSSVVASYDHSNGDHCSSTGQELPALFRLKSRA